MPPPAVRRECTSALVVGAAGFWGSALVAELIGRGATVIAVDRSARGPEHPSVQWCAFDAGREPQRLAECLAQTPVEVIFHLGGTASVPASVVDPLLDFDENARATLAVLETLRTIDAPPLLVHASSAAVYGNSVRLPMDEDHPLHPISPYGAAKLAAERYVTLYAEAFGVPGFSVRPFSLYGPGAGKQVVHDLIVRIESGEDPLEIAAPWQVARDFVYVADAAAALYQLATQAPAVGEQYNIASGESTTLEVLARTIAEAAGAQIDTRFTGALRPGDPVSWRGDPTAAQRLGARCATTLGDGIAACIAAFRIRPS